MKKLIYILVVLLINTSCKQSQEDFTNRQYQDTIIRLHEENDSLRYQLRQCDNWVNFLESEPEDTISKSDEILKKISQLIKFRDNRNQKEQERVYQYLDSLIKNDGLDVDSVTNEELIRLIGEFKDNHKN